jgi:hypothetical protein
MMACHELFGFMPPELANEVLEFTYASEKPVYRAALAAVADARKVRPVYLEKQPRPARHKTMVDMLSRPRMEQAAITAELLRGWLVKAQKPMLVEFLDTLSIPHKDGVVEDFPEQVDEQKLGQAIEGLLGKFPAPNVIVYLHTLCATNDGGWANLRTRLQEDSRLQFA